MKLKKFIKKLNKFKEQYGDDIEIYIDNDYGLPYSDLECGIAYVITHTNEYYSPDPFPCKSELGKMLASGQLKRIIDIEPLEY